MARYAMGASSAPQRRHLLSFVLGVLAAVQSLWMASQSARADDPHVVQPGETLSSIAAEHGLTLVEIADLNGVGDVDLIVAGATLRTSPAVGGTPPVSAAPVTHRVALGETLAVIAAAYGVDLDALAEANLIEDVDFVVEGQLLVIPVPAAVGAMPRAGEVPPGVTWEEAETALRAAAHEFGLSPGLLLALSWQESGWQQDIVSHAGAVGLMQLLPSTASWVVQDLVGGDPDWWGSAHANARVGAALLNHLLDLAGGDVPAALAAYYQGWASVATYGPFEETREYVHNVVALVAWFE